MAVFKFLVSACLAFASLPAEGDGGWFSVKKEQKTEEIVEMDSLAIWVLFVKKMGEETFQVRFPEEPSYRYTEKGDLEVRAYDKGEVFELTVRKAKGSEAMERVYALDNLWVQERIVPGDTYEYSLKTYAKKPDAPKHKDFAFSLSVDRSGP